MTARAKNQIEEVRETMKLMVGAAQMMEGEDPDNPTGMRLFLGGVDQVAKEQLVSTKEVEKAIEERVRAHMEELVELHKLHVEVKSWRYKLKLEVRKTDQEQAEHESRSDAERETRQSAHYYQ